MIKFPAYTRKEITREQYQLSWSLDLVVVATVTDPSGCISPLSTPGVSRVVTTWGKAENEPLIECNTEGRETAFFEYTKKTKCGNCKGCSCRK